jgi:hypothetical protein
MLLVALVAAALAIPALGVSNTPGVRAAQTSGSVTTRGEARSGSLITLTGKGFEVNSILQARWDVPAVRLGFISVNRSGGFTSRLRIPAGAAVGIHTISLGRVTAATVRLYRDTTRVVSTATLSRIRIYVPPAPAPTGATVPTSIDATCSTNVSAALNAWIASEPDGSRLVFPAGSCYQLGGDAGLNLTGRSGLTLDGTGSTLQLRTTGATNFSSAFFLQSSTHITIRGFAVDGGNTATGTTSASSYIKERMNGASVAAGCAFIEFDHVSWDRLRGFGVILSAAGGSAWPSDISIHDSFIRGGEMGIAIVAGRNVQIERDTINDSVYIAIDLEPDASVPGAGFRNVLIADNDVTRYAWGQNLTSWFVAANPADAVLDTTVMDGLTITGNRVHVGAATADNGNADGLGGLGIRADKSNLKTNFVITNNWTLDTDTRASGAVINLANVQNLTVTGNRQPIANGVAFVRDTGTTGTRVVSANDITP